MAKVGRPRGYKLSEETKKKISEANRGKNHPLYGKERSEETKEKIAQALKREWRKMKEAERKLDQLLEIIGG